MEARADVVTHFGAAGAGVGGCLVLAPQRGFPAALGAASSRGSPESGPLCRRSRAQRRAGVGGCGVAAGRPAAAWRSFPLKCGNVAARAPGRFRARKTEVSASVQHTPGPVCAGASAQRGRKPAGGGAAPRAPGSRLPLARPLAVGAGEEGGTVDRDGATWAGRSFRGCAENRGMKGGARPFPT